MKINSLYVKILFHKTAVRLLLNLVALAMMVAAAIAVAGSDFRWSTQFAAGAVIALLTSEIVTSLAALRRTREAITAIRSIQLLEGSVRIQGVDHSLDMGPLLKEMQEQLGSPDGSWGR